MAVQDYVTTTLASARQLADRVAPPASRQRAYDAVRVFADEHFLLFLFIATQSLFALIPVLIFASFVLSIIAVATVCGLVFSLFWIGVAGCVLGATLCVTGGFAVVVWVGCVAANAGWGFVMGGAPEGEKGRTEVEDGPSRQDLLVMHAKLKQELLDMTQRANAREDEALRVVDERQTEKLRQNRAKANLSVSSSDIDGKQEEKERPGTEQFNGEEPREFDTTAQRFNFQPL